MRKQRQATGILQGFLRDTAGIAPLVVLGVLAGATALGAVAANLASWAFALVRISRLVRRPLAEVFPWPTYLRVLALAVAAAALEAAVREDPLSGAAWTNLGVLRMRAGDRDAARAARRRSHGHSPGSWAAINSKASGCSTVIPRPCIT